MPQFQSSAEQRTSVLGRIIQPERADLSAEAARYFLKLAFEPADLERMHELAGRHQRGDLSKEEQADLADYRQTGLLLDLLKSKARLSLRKRGLPYE
jgi:hypothetical protein